MAQDPNLTIEEPRPGERHLKHPSFGMLRINRWSGATKEHLFHTNVETGAGMSIELSEAELIQRDSSEHVFGHSKVLFRVDLSPAQFADLLTNMNAEGACCTIRQSAAYPGYSVPRPPVLDTAMAKVESEFNQAMLDLEIIDEEVGMQLRKALEKLPAKHRATITEAINILSDRVKSQIPYIREKFEEATASHISQAKAEIDAYVTTMIQALGVEKLRETAPTLNFTRQTPTLGTKEPE